ncbi:MAG: hypothetical protein Q8922_05805 [Bacteroidota bacterium]|nr:hypothetical protein [Bacteroidota bacterium]MDP4234065.1 hypothetical protein [Bacteroidota bacterium]MDP4243006.1 hypothetical protein [Bacteroidota bacterium]MDP4287432.1 hypothetical protein [Bacteroidota bacterium]
MLALRQTMTVPQDHVLHLRVDDIPAGAEVEVLVRTKGSDPDMESKLARMAQAANDPLFLADIQEFSS